MNFLTKIFGSKHDRDVKKMQPIVDEINQFYEEYGVFVRRGIKRQNSGVSHAHCRSD